MVLLCPNDDRPLQCGETLGSGTYGSVKVGPSGRDALKFGEMDFEKIAYLIANPVVARHPGYTYAWPQMVVNDRDTGQPCAYLMSAAADGLDTAHLFSRASVPGAFRLRIVLNHARSLVNLEAAGYRRGDMPNSLFHQDASITEIDLDSLQIDHAGAVFNSYNAKAATAAPEVLELYTTGCPEDAPTTRQHDAWAFASLAWLILMQGEHPFDGVPNGAAAAKNTTERVIAGQWPYDPSCLLATPRPGARPLNDLDPDLQELFRQTFIGGHPNRDPSSRPTLSAWQSVLERIDGGGP